MKETDTSASKTDDFNAATLLTKTMIGTTWRMFLPTVGLTLLGLWLDDRTGLRPKLTLMGIVIGVIVAAVLAFLQIAKIKRQESNK